MEEVRRKDRWERKSDGQRPAGEIWQDRVFHGDCSDKADTKLNMASHAMPSHLLKVLKKPFQIKLCSGLPM